MKFLDKLALAIFSIIIFAVSAISIIIVFGWLNLDIINDVLKYIFTQEPVSNITLGVSIFLLLLSLKCIFFSTSSPSNSGSRDGILLENDNGKLLVSRDTLENLSTSVAKTFESTENVVSRVTVDKDGKLIIYISLQVKTDAIIKDLSANLQSKIKATIKESLDLDVKEVNLKVKNIATAKNPQVANVE
ncbi:MAG: alkaline shock response membrane anchor protein AmaP [Lachnospiraceae bacterium]|jgi:uncharacterized alkaline shock family protein YloU|nr:alkaline shock response membrane anchor protein AmaP [Lachnospiraceae bacterium]